MAARTDEPTKPNVVLTIVLGFLAPGAGLWYAGRPRAAITFLALFLASVVALPMMAVDGVIDPARLPSLLALSALALWGPAVAWGALTAVRAEPAVRSPWTHPWWVLGVIVLAWAGSSALRSRIVIPHLVSFAPVLDHRWEPELHQGALVVVKRRYAPSEVRAGTIVLVADDKSESKERLVKLASTDSGLVCEDGTRISPADVLGVGVAAR